MLLLIDFSIKLLDAIIAIDGFLLVTLKNNFILIWQLLIGIYKSLFLCCISCSFMVWYATAIILVNSKKKIRDGLEGKGTLLISKSQASLKLWKERMDSWNWYFDLEMCAGWASVCNNEQV